MAVVKLLLYALGFLFMQKVSGQCGGTPLALTSSSVATGTLTSLDFPNNYANNVDCTWTITAATAGDVVVASVEVKDLLSDDDNCLNDFIELYSGSVHPDNIILILCDKTAASVKPVASSTGEVLVLRMLSDDSGTATGFSLKFFSVSSTGQQSCGANLGEPNIATAFYNSLPGTFSAESSCRWYLNTGNNDVGHQVDVLFADFNDCSLDGFNIHDGVDTTEPLLASICYKSTDGFTGSYVTTGKKMAFDLFASSTTGDKYGILLTYQTRSLLTTSTTTSTTIASTTTVLAVQGISSCLSSGVTLTAQSGAARTITSPNYPSTYNNSVTCIWTIYTPNIDDVIQLEFSTFALESDVYCIRDYLAVYDGDNTSNILINRFCGTSIPGTIKSTGSNIHLYFRADDAISATGFSLTYQLVSTANPGCATGVAQLTAAPSPSVITSTGYPSAYSNNVDEYWILQNPDPATYVLVVHMTSTSTEQTQACSYDRITIYDGPCTSDPVLYRYCGSMTQKWQLSTGTQYLVHFHTDSSVTDIGFQMHYYLVTSTTTPTTTTTTTTAGPPVPAVVDLMREVLNTSKYDLSNRPSRDLSVPVAAHVNFFLLGVKDLDEVKQKLTIAAVFEVTWSDDYLVWLPDKKKNIVKLLVPQDLVWKPDVVLLNGFTETKQMGDSFMYVVLNYNGTLSWKPYQILTSTCKVDMAYYPYDTQTCDLKIGTWAGGTSDVTIAVGENGIRLHERFQQNSKWKLVRTGIRTSDGSVVTFTITLKRHSTFGVFYLLVPVILLSIVNVFTFALDLGTKERTGLSLTVFLSFMTYLVFITGKVPKNSDKVPYFGIYVLTLCLVSFFTVIISVMELRMNNFNKKEHRIGKWLYKFTIFLARTTDKFLCLQHSPFSQKNVSIEGQETAKDTKHLSLTWKNVTASVDFLLFWIFHAITTVVTCVYLAHSSE